MSSSNALSIVPQRLNYKDYLWGQLKKQAADQLASFALKGAKKASRGLIEAAPKGAKAIKEHYQNQPLQFGIRVPKGKRRQDSGTAEQMAGGSRAYRRGSTVYSKYKSKRKGGKKREGKRSSKRAGRGGRRTKRSNRQKLISVGYSMVHEYGGVVDSRWNAVVGHSTHHWNSLMRTFCGALVKLILNKIGYMHVQPEGQLPNVSTGDVITIRYRPNADQFPAIEGGITATLASTDTFAGVVDKLCTSFAAIWGTALTGRDPQIAFSSITYAPDGSNDGTRAEISLVGAMFSFFCQSELTLQNRTANESTDPEITDIDAVPLKGFVFAGNGSGAVARALNLYQANMPKANLIADRNGLITLPSFLYQPPGTDPIPPMEDITPRWVKEPFHKQMFANVKQYSPLAMAPGSLLKNVLVYEKNMSIDRFFLDMLNMQYNGTVATGGTKFIKSNIGNYKFFSFEKYIEVSPQGAVPSVLVNIAYELNHTTAGMIKPKLTKYTVRDAFINDYIPVFNNIV